MARHGAQPRIDGAGLRSLLGLICLQLTPAQPSDAPGWCAMSRPAGRPLRGGWRSMTSTGLDPTPQRVHRADAAPEGAGSPYPPEDAGEDLTPGPDAAEVNAEHAETWRLITAAQGGDGDAFGALYDRYVDTVYKYIYYRVNDRALAEDFTSETFLRALRRIGGFTYQGRDIGAWFITIARNIIFDHTKSARHRLELSTGDVPEADDVADSTEATVVAAFTAQFLLDAIAKLSDEQRDCITLRFIEDLSIGETAKLMGKNEGAIKALQHRAVKKLAQLVGGALR